MQNGDTIIYTADNLGSMTSDQARGFDGRNVRRGEIGLYVGPHPNPTLAEQDWHMTLVKNDDGSALFVPVGIAHFQPA